LLKGFGWRGGADIFFILDFWGLSSELFGVLRQINPTIPLLP